MIKRNIGFILGSIFFLSLVLILFFFLNIKKVTVKVLDEKNAPIENAVVKINYIKLSPKPAGKGWGTNAKSNIKQGVTDTVGIFSARGLTNTNIPVSAVKNGYYKSSGGISYDNSGKPDKEVVTLILRQKINPIPMYAKHTDWMKIPVFDQPVGYDLQCGDWVNPYGKGHFKDFIFVFAAAYQDRFNFEISCKLSFSNPNDGIIQYMPSEKNRSQYKWPFTAPKDGYLQNIEKHEIYLRSSNKKEHNIIKGTKYLYRVRTKTDSSGNIISTNYGKMDGDIELSQGRGPQEGSVKFSYYFNPDGTPNLEFDTEKNLFIPEGAEKWKSKFQNYTGFRP